MFFCDSCKVEREWPGWFIASFGKCEMCGKSAPCYDVPSKLLPAPPKKIKDRWSTHDIALLAAQIAELVEQYDLKTEFEPTDLAVDFVFTLLQYNDKEQYDTDVMGN